MSLTGPGRTAAVLCTAVVLCGTLAAPANADRPLAAMAPATSLLAAALTVPASPEIPSPGDIAAAKSSESATAAKVADIEGILADAAKYDASCASSGHSECRRAMPSSEPAWRRARCSAVAVGVMPCRRHRRRPPDPPAARERRSLRSVRAGLGLPN